MFAVMMYGDQGHLKRVTWFLILTLVRGATTDMSSNIGNRHTFSTKDFLRPDQFQSKVLEIHLRKSFKVRPDI